MQTDGGGGLEIIRLGHACHDLKGRTSESLQDYSQNPGSENPWHNHHKLVCPLQSFISCAARDWNCDLEIHNPFELRGCFVDPCKRSRILLTSVSWSAPFARSSGLVESAMTWDPRCITDNAHDIEALPSKLEPHDSHCLLICAQASRRDFTRPVSACAESIKRPKNKTGQARCLP